MESTAELLLLMSISGDFFFRIAGAVEELALIRFNSHVALSEVAKLFPFSVHDPLRNVAGTESRLKGIPSDDFPNRQ